jgi:uncharacterized Zn finger protein
MRLKRVEKGMQIFNEGRVFAVSTKMIPYDVEGDTGKTYKVELNPHNGMFTCTCEDFKIRQRKCKHIWAVEFYRDGS